MAVPGLTRVRKELAGLMKSLPPIVREVTLSNNNERDWIVVLAPDREPFNGGTFKIRVVFGDRYPFQPPNVTFETKVYHPNVEQKSGKICFAMINPESWRAGVAMRDVFDALNKILAEPEMDRPSNGDAARNFQENKDEYLRRVKACIAENASNEHTGPSTQEGTKELQTSQQEGQAPVQPNGVAQSS